MLSYLLNAYSGILMKSSKQGFPIFIINLEKDIEKRNHMQKLCDKYNLSPQFIQAIDGKLLSSDEVELLSSKKSSIKSIGRELSKGEIGCALSHLKIYKLLIKKQIEAAIILEDDVEFNENLDLIISHLSSFPKDLELLLLGHHSQISRELNSFESAWFKTKITETYSAVRLNHVACGAYGYLITLKGAKKLSKITKIKKPIDFYTGVSYYTNTYGISPPCINISKYFESFSNLTPERDYLNNLNKKNNIFKQLLKIIRIINFSKKIKIYIYYISHKYYYKYKPIKKY